MKKEKGHTLLQVPVHIIPVKTKFNKLPDIQSLCIYTEKELVKTSNGDDWKNDFDVGLYHHRHNFQELLKYLSDIHIGCTYIQNISEDDDFMTIRSIQLVPYDSRIYGKRQSDILEGFL